MQNYPNYYPYEEKCYGAVLYQPLSLLLLDKLNKGKNCHEIKTDGSDECQQQASEGFVEIIRRNA